MSKKITNKEATIRGLRAYGCVDSQVTSSKYEVFEAPYEGGGLAEPRPLYLVGKSGALRVTEGNLSESVSLTDRLKHRAFRYIGRLSVAIKDGIDEYTYRDIWRGVVDGEIPVTKDGYYAEG